MLGNFLVITDPVGTLKTRRDRVVHKSHLGAHLPESAVLDSIDTTVKKYQEVMALFGRDVAVTKLHPYLTRMEIHGADGSLSAVRDIQVLYYDEDEDE